MKDFERWIKWYIKRWEEKKEKYQILFHDFLRQEVADEGIEIVEYRREQGYRILSKG